MSKKLSLTLTAIIATIGLTTFSISNAFALDGESPDTAPLTSAKELCKEAKANYNESVSNIKAVGLSTQKTKAEINQQIKDLKDYKTKVCAEAKTEGLQPLTSAVQLCKDAQKTYGKDVQYAKAKGLSNQMTKAQINQLVKDVKDYKTKVCAESKGKVSPLTSAAQLCKEAQKSYYKDVQNTKAKGLSNQITKEQIDQMVKDLKDYKAKVCAEAKTK
jgi:hypothetical protein